jgi:hypothetical protein
VEGLSLESWWAIDLLVFQRDDISPLSWSLILFNEFSGCFCINIGIFYTKIAYTRDIESAHLGFSSSIKEDPPGWSLPYQLRTFCD